MSVRVVLDAFISNDRHKLCARVSFRECSDMRECPLAGWFTARTSAPSSTHEKQVHEPVVQKAYYRGASALPSLAIRILHARLRHLPLVRVPRYRIHIPETRPLLLLAQLIQPLPPIRLQKARGLVVLGLRCELLYLLRVVVF